MPNEFHRFSRDNNCNIVRMGFNTYKIRTKYILELLDNGIYKFGEK